MGKTIPVLRMIALVGLALVSLPAAAVYKCVSNNTVTYSDHPCAGGKRLQIEDDIHTRTADVNAAERRVNSEKEELKRLQLLRHRKEAREEKERERAMRTASRKTKRCRSLALQTKWSNEDAATKAGRAGDKAKLKARRMTEQLEMECGNGRELAG